MLKKIVLFSVVMSVIALLCPAAVTTARDAFEIAVDDQVILPGEQFTPILLAEIAPEDMAEIAWSVTGNEALQVQITDEAITITPPEDGWLGTETLQFEVCDPAGICATDEAIFWAMAATQPPVTVTFVGNAGFLITVGDKKILIDGLFEGLNDNYWVPDDVIELLETAAPPFDNIDLILITHEHADHYSRRVTRRHLENNPEAVLVSVPNVARQMALYAQTIPVDLAVGESTQMVVADMGLEVLNILHGPVRDGQLVILNLGFVITVDGVRILHTGDLDAANVSVEDLRDHYGLVDKHITLGMVPHFILTRRDYRTRVTEGIQPDYVIPIHYAYTVPAYNERQITRNFPDAVVFQAELESWTMPE
ncbi:MAG: MBL fold metallo-hydrolase [Anaerolineae bacterium]|nr:MBL fold metallo-hydrolase [Anaerolineae bacterium]